MIPVNSAAQAAREERRYFREVPMLWITARDWDTNEEHGIGLWQGDDVEDIDVVDITSGMVVRHTFYNKGILSIGDVRYESGLNFRPVTISLARVNAAVLVAMAQYDARGGEVQMWRRCYDQNLRPIAVEQWDFGYVNTAPSERASLTDAEGKAVEWTIDLEIVSETRLLSEPSQLRKSHAAQVRRSGDAIRRYKSRAKWPVPWGIKDLKKTAEE